MTTHTLGKGRPWRFGRGNTARTDMTGQQIGRWRVVGPGMSLGTGARWTCECTECGERTTVRGSELRKNRVACQGCKAKEANP